MQRKGNVIFLGSPYWSEYLAKLLNDRQHLRAHTLRDVGRWLFSANKSLCFVGLGPPNTWKRKLYYHLSNGLDFLGLLKHKVIYWIGSDTLLLARTYTSLYGFRHIAGSSWLAAEVSEQGLNCSTCWFPVKLDLDSNVPWPMDAPLRVLCYIPDAHHQLHGSDEVVYLASRHPDILFRVVGGSGSWMEEELNNVQFFGWVENIHPLIQDSHILLRRTRHDSFSAFVREGIAADRHIISTFNIGTVIFVRSGDLEALDNEITKLSTKFAQRELGPNVASAEFKRELLDLTTHLIAIENIFK